MKINMTGDSWDFLRGLVRDTSTEIGTSPEPKKPNGRAASMASDDDGDDSDDDDVGPSQNWKEWKEHARRQRDRAFNYRQKARTHAQELEAERAARAEDKAKFERDMAALRTESENARTAAVAEAAKKADQRLIRIEMKAALKEAGCKDVEDGLKLIDGSAITVSEAGDVTGVKEAIDQLKASKAYLFEGAASSSTSSTAKAPDPKDPAPKKATEMTDEEYRAARAAYTKTSIRRGW